MSQTCNLHFPVCINSCKEVSESCWYILNNLVDIFWKQFHILMVSWARQTCYGLSKPKLVRPMELLAFYLLITGRILISMYQNHHLTVNCQEFYFTKLPMCTHSEYCHPIVIPVSTLNLILLDNCIVFSKIYLSHSMSTPGTCTAARLGFFSFLEW